MGEAARKIEARAKEQSQLKTEQKAVPPLQVVPLPIQKIEPTMFHKVTSALHQTPVAFQKMAMKQIETAAEMVHDPLNLRVVRATIHRHILNNPMHVMEERMWRMAKYNDLWQYSWATFWGLNPKAVIEPAKGDNRWRAEEWSKKLWFDCAKQSYLIWSQSIDRLVKSIKTEDPKMRKRIAFYTKLFVDSWSPTNFAWSNPEVIAKTFSTFGENLIDGYLRFLQDIEKGNGNLTLSNIDTEKFKVGETVAITPGKVVFQNELMQLIQYSPTTDTVAETPILVTPAWINKYYILDLQPKNSLIKFMVDKGHTVFAISWVNPGKELSHKRFDDYLLEGPVEAIKQIKKTTGAEQVNLVGYCLGGTLTTTTAAYLKAKGDKSVKSLTLLTTLTDFSEPGDLGFFIDEKQVASLEKKMEKKGFLGAEEMTAAFNLLKSNELLFQSAVGHYFLAKPPSALDFLAWNSDATRMPAAMHSFYLRKMYIENALCKPNGLSFAGTPISLNEVKVPVYQVSAKEDHIAPWQSVYAGTQIFKGPRRFVVSESGHIAGVVNPPAAKKYNHWVNDDLPTNPIEWFEKATYTMGSWWDDWANWMNKTLGDKQVPARDPANGELKPLEDAPGSYVKTKAV